jgi:hypothetical protein
MTDAYFGGDLSELAKRVREAEVPIFAFAIAVRAGAAVILQVIPVQRLSCFRTLPTAPSAPGGTIDLTHPFLDMLTKETADAPSFSKCT